ncbi:MAG: hypothetical protein F6K31_01190 [Symploca sp. SIO2G7]|nr:hypothetical protein [Symploca sp. SIO2G7]
MRIGNWELGIGHWELGIGHWALVRRFSYIFSPISLSPHLPISPSPHLPISLSPYLLVRCVRCVS